MIASLSLTNFKSFQAASAGLGPLTVVVGTNASGKSNLREALRVLHGIGRGYTLAEVLGEKYGPGGAQQWRGIRGGARGAGYLGAAVFSIEVELKGISPRSDKAHIHARYRIDIDVSDETLGPRVVRETLTDLARPHGIVFYSHPPAAEETPVAADQLQMISDPATPEVPISMGWGVPSSRPALSTLAINSGSRLPIHAYCTSILDLLASMRFLDLDPEAMRVPSQPGQVILGDRGENLSSVMQAICQDPARKATLLQWVRALTPMDATDFEFLSDFSGRVLVHLVEAGGYKVSAISASDGTLRFLALTAALLSEDSGRMYFFEEFDNGIHPTRLHLLLDLVQRACDSGSVQVIGTTHNPAMLAYLSESARNSALLVYRGDPDHGSKLRRIADLPDVDELLASQDLGRLHQAGWLENAAIFSEPDEDAG